MKPEPLQSNDGFDALHLHQVLWQADAVFKQIRAQSQWTIALHEIQNT